MTGKEIVEQVAKERRVEQLAEHILASHAAVTKDLCQLVYLALLNTREDRLIDLWENEEINYYIVRIIKNQWRSTTSEVYRFYRKYDRRARQLQEER